VNRRLLNCRPEMVRGSRAFNVETMTRVEVERTAWQCRYG
jgi:hypothetical protein